MKADALHTPKELMLAAERVYLLAKSMPESREREARLQNARKLVAMARGLTPAEKADVNENPDDERKRFRKAVRPRVRFADIAGLDGVKEEVRLKLLYPILHAAKAKKYGIKTGGGVLLYGPPGCGKTLIAKAIAGEIDAAFFTVKPSEIMSKWVGEAEQNIEELFKTARAEPLSVIFIDEIEALVPRRRDSHSTVMQRVVPQILAELEGFDTAGKNPILFLGASNEPWALDPAVMRPGRFDEKIYVGLPDERARRRMLSLYLRGRPLGHGLDLDSFAERLDGYSGADIRNICDKAASEAFLGSIEGDAEIEIDGELLDRVLAVVRPSVQPGDLAKFEKYAETT